MCLFSAIHSSTDSALASENKHISSLINFFKLLLLFATFGFIFYKLFYAYHLNDLLSSSSSFNPKRHEFLFFVPAVLLSTGNWMLEASKWRLLINKYEYISFPNAIKAVLSGVSLSIITPNQIGDFAGRIIHLKKFNKIKGTLVTIIGHAAQMFMTAAFGFYALVWLLDDQQQLKELPANYIYFLLFVLIVLSVWAFLNIKYLSRLSFNQKIVDYLSVFSHYKRSELMQVLMLSFLRYSIFVCQYYLLLYFYGVAVKPDQAFVCIIATLCVQSFVPSFILVELGMRGASALWFFGMYTGNVTGILLSAYTLWIINLMIPGLLGLGIIMRWRFLK
ncbi:MAG: lysylphosphatidylglycerol synthase domain-containing protein [Bacteroidota bacterium]|jgi:hypothetical protein|nr:flippase-like domain-containing protein [Sphingobacteriales bacterium]